MTYNLKRYLKLLKRSQDLDNQGKDLFLENEEEYFELSNYKIAIEHHIFWQNRYQIGLLMEDFLNRKIDAEEFCNLFNDLRYKLLNASKEFQLELTSGSEKIKNFQPDSRSKNMRGLLTCLFFECEDFDDDYENDEFYNSIKDTFLNFQEVLNEE